MAIDLAILAPTFAAALLFALAFAFGWGEGGGAESSAGAGLPEVVGGPPTLAFSDSVAGRSFRPGLAVPLNFPDPLDPDVVVPVGSSLADARQKSSPTCRFIPI